MNWRQFFLRAVLLSPGVALAAALTPGIFYDDWVTLVWAVVLLSILNSFLKPLLMLFSLPFILLTFGFGILLINAVLVLLVGAVIPGFEVAGFGAAFWGGLIISITGLIVSVLVGGNQGPGGPRARVSVHVNRGGQARSVSESSQSSPRPGRTIRKDDDVIDI